MAAASASEKGKWELVDGKYRSTKLDNQSVLRSPAGGASKRNMKYDGLAIFDRSIDEKGLLAKALLPTVRLVEYNSDLETFADLKKKILAAHAENLGSFRVVALANHGAENWKITKDLTINLKANATVAAIIQGQELFSLLVSVVKKDVGRIDMLACNLLTHDPYLVLGLEEFYAGVNFAASSNPTGNTTLPDAEKLDIRNGKLPASTTAAASPKQTGADWVMESDAVDIAKDYFDANRLKAYDAQMFIGFFYSAYQCAKNPTGGNFGRLGLSILTMGLY